MEGNITRGTRANPYASISEAVTAGEEQLIVGPVYVHPRVIDEAMIDRVASWFDKQDVVNGATGYWLFEWTKPFVEEMLRVALGVPNGRNT